MLCHRNDQTASKQKEAPVPTIIVQINNVSSDSLLARTKEALSFPGFDPKKKGMHQMEVQNEGVADQGSGGRTNLSILHKIKMRA